MRRRPLIALAAALPALLAARAGAADTLRIDPSIGPAPEGPSRFMTMAEVEARFGPPRERTGPVGDPPITVWTYDRFKVYFERDRVLHVTAHRATAAASGSGG